MTPPDDALGQLLARAVQTRRDAVRARLGQALLQRVTDEQVVAEGVRLWTRQGMPATQTAEEKDAELELATRNTRDIEAEARRLGEERTGASTDLDRERDWAAGLHAVRHRRIVEARQAGRKPPTQAEEVGSVEELAEKRRQREEKAKALAVRDWQTAGEQLALEELWERCDPRLRLPGEDAEAAWMRADAETKALKQTPGYKAEMVDALLDYDYGRSPRPFVTVTDEDPHGGHTVKKHVTTGSLEAERRNLATRVVTHGAYVGGPCPGKACSFEDVPAADDAVAAALRLLWQKDGGWAATGAARDKFARGNHFQGVFRLSVPIRGIMQVREPFSHELFPVAERPVYFADPAAVGNRPLFSGDSLCDPSKIPQYPARKRKAAEGVVWDLARPMTVNGVPSEVAIRVNPLKTAEGGWFVNSAWPQ